MVAAVSAWLAVAGLLAGLGCWLVISELIPAGPSLRAAIDRLDSDAAAGPMTRPRSASGSVAAWLPPRPGCRCPRPTLRLLGQDPAAWLASKVSYGVLGLALVPALSALVALGGHSLPWTVPAGATLAIGVAAVLPARRSSPGSTRAQKRADFRHALTSYLDLVALERGAGAAPTEALEAAAEVGSGWAFEPHRRSAGRSSQGKPAAMGRPGAARG